jgi:hypothetical protein
MSFEVLRWCPGPESNRHAITAADFKSAMSTDFITGAVSAKPYIMHTGHSLHFF